ncbi:hypothetical protein BZG04_15825 [Salinivibrio kushneri]|uniref:Fimbrial-type adhesion domain-containing protein n=1 Tax=Salinivibrio kushneri TaxID=1908198 RepID=A0AB36JTW6_9GAMM|nr:fimbrial protein [Salinivibrio kushneri]OOE32039.1 hypothetical protein BZG04_15825 [Salinivibrio kushneri]OOE39110.1 hypothetical protein BZG09_16985 [Salinivibrio kushneri]
MKNVLKNSSIIMAALFSASTFAADGTIRFTGSVSATTCSVHGGAGTNGGGLSDAEVKLPKVSVDQLKADGDSAGSTPFSIIIGGEGEATCSDGEIASLHFEPQLSPMIDPSTGRLNNASSPDAAKNLQVEILNDRGEPINLYHNSNVSKADISGNKAILDFTARYKANGGKVTAGKVDTNIVYTVTYN